MLKLISRISLLTVLMLCAAWAQAKDSAPESRGILAGGFVLHPGAELGLAYDGRGSQGNDDGFVDIGVFFKTRLENEDLRSWNNEVSLKWRQYWGVGDADPNGGLEARVSTSADLFKKSLFRLAPSASYQFLNDPEDDNLRVDFENHTVNAGVNFFIQPGEGAVFSQQIGYHLSGRLYTERSEVSNLTHRIESVTRWSFLPQSSMALTLGTDITQYLEETREGTGVPGASGDNANAYPFRIKYSLQGLLLERLSYVLGLGYAYVYYDNKNTEHMFIMNARLAYSFQKDVNLSLEYKKDFNNVVYGDYYKLHQVSLRFDALWFEHLQTKAEVGFGAFDYRTLEAASRNDYLLTARADIYYHFFPGLKLGLEYRLRYNTSDADDADYVKNLVSLNLSYTY